MEKRLEIISVENSSQNQPASQNNRQKRKFEAEVKFNQLWKDNPKQFDPERNCIERERVKRTLELLEKHTPLSKKHIVDLGSGYGTIARLLLAKGAKVDAVDISESALAKLKQSLEINLIQDLVPMTHLEDDHYDIVISTELIGFLPKEERRLYFAELSRLVKPDGFVLCSTGFDIYTEDGLQAFADLVETEFHPIEWTLSSNAFLIAIKDILKAPENFIKGYKDKNFRNQQSLKKHGFNKFWYKLNSTAWTFPFWKIISFLTTPLFNLFDQNRSLMLIFEKLCRTLKSNGGISHAIFIGQRRPLVIPTSEELMAIEPKHKKQVWE